MKKDIHHSGKATVTCACGETFETTTRKRDSGWDLKLSSLFTGKQQLLIRVKVEKFQKRMEKPERKFKTSSSALF